MRKQVENKKPTTPLLIKAHGEFWNRDWVNWKSGRILGKRSKRGKPVGPDINLYKQFGVYVLYWDCTPAYVGQGNIGQRIRGRQNKVRWNQFSWYGVCALDSNNHLKRKTLQLGGATDQVVDTLEALLIRALTPKLNNKKEKLNGAIRIHQSETDRPAPELSKFFLWMQDSGHQLPKAFKDDSHRLVKKYWNEREHQR